MLSVKVSAVIIAFNEERNISDAVESVRWADEILVVDSESTDKTREIAEALGARVLVRPWDGFSRQKQYAADNAAHDWVLSLDADERVTAALRKEIEGLLLRGPESGGYSIPRLSIYMGREIRHGGWYPDRQLRLFDRRRARWKDRLIHESVELVDGSKSGSLAGDLLHYSVEGPQHHALMIAERYAPLSAQQMKAEGANTNRTKALISAFSAFIRSYILKLGCLDGFPGLMIAYFAAQNSLLKHLILLEISKRDTKDRRFGVTTTKIS